jgi:hypothetical protein
MHNYPDMDVGRKSDEDKRVTYGHKRQKYVFFGHEHEGALKKSAPLDNIFGLNEFRVVGKDIKNGAVGFLEMSGSESNFLYLP